MSRRLLLPVALLLPTLALVPATATATTHPIVAVGSVTAAAPAPAAAAPAVIPALQSWTPRDESVFRIVDAITQEAMDASGPPDAAGLGDTVVQQPRVVARHATWQLRNAS